MKTALAFIVGVGIAATYLFYLGLCMMAKRGDEAMESADGAENDSKRN